MIFYSKLTTLIYFLCTISIVNFFTSSCIMITEKEQKQTRSVNQISQDWTFKISDKAQENVKIPHTWNAIDAANGGGKTNSSVDGKEMLRGKGLYTTNIGIKKDPTKRYFLKFEGSSIETDVIINAQKVGSHNGAFGAFSFEITDKLLNGNNKIEIIADNTFNINNAPSSGDFSIFGGVYRPVYFITTEKDCISPIYNGTNGVRIWQESLTNEQGLLKVAVNLSLAKKEANELLIRVLDSNQKIVAEKSCKITGELVEALLTVPTPTRWNGIKNPYLYTIRAELKKDNKTIDSIDDTWGFRTIEICPKKGFILNGEVVKMHGVNRHQDKEGLGWARSDEDQLQDVKMMKEIGANCVRLAHYMHAPIVYKALEKEGIIIYAEAPVVDRTNDTFEFYQNAMQQLKELIEQHQNRSAIAVWSISNELRNGPNGSTSKGETKLMSLMYKECKKLDPTRYVVLAANSFSPASNEYVDHIAFNSYPGWYGGSFYNMKNIIESWRKKYPKKGIAISEYGAGGGANTHEYPLKRPQHVHPWHPEEYQAICHEQQWRAIKNSITWGSYVWNMFDFAADERREGENLGRNDKGLVSMDRKTRKDAFFFYKANWTDTPMVHITSKRFNPRNAGLMPIKIYSNCDTVALFVGNDFIGESKGDDCGVFLFNDVWFNKGKNTFKAIAKRGDSTIEDTVTFDVK